MSARRMTGFASIYGRATFRRLSRERVGGAPDPPGFNEPWEAEALALSIALQEKGYVTATEWATVLGVEIQTARAFGDPDDATTYYRHVLAALERVVSDKDLVTADALRERRRDWEGAYRRTPHGRKWQLEESEHSLAHDPPPARRQAGRRSAMI